jgi:hypothetical protein
VSAAEGTTRRPRQGRKRGPLRVIIGPLWLSSQHEAEARLSGLRELARLVFLDRNARGMPVSNRSMIKAAARPHLRQAIKHLRRSRDALRTGNIALHECERDRARMYAAFAKIEFFQPFANKTAESYGHLAVGGLKGAAKTKAKFSREREGLEGRIERTLKCGEMTSGYVMDWADAYYVSKSTVYRAIERVRKKLAKR